MRSAMRKRAESSGITLSENDASLVKGMLARGDRQHDIAAWFGVNSGRIAEIALQRTFFWVEATPLDALPPPGPYPSGSQAMKAEQALKTVLVAAESALSCFHGRSGSTSN